MSLTHDQTLHYVPISIGPIKAITLLLKHSNHINTETIVEDCFMKPNSHLVTNRNKQIKTIVFVLSFWSLLFCSSLFLFSRFFFELKIDKCIRSMNNTTEQTNKQKLLDKMGGDYGYGFINNFSKCDLYIAFDVSVGSTQYFFLFSYETTKNRTEPKSPETSGQHQLSRLFLPI